MASRLYTSQLEHDSVVKASAATYSEWRGKGYEVNINPGGEKNRSVGTLLNPQYPDVVVWLPNSIGSTSGTAKIIEEIETADSVTETEANQWKDYGKLGAKFLLVVPLGSENEALRLIKKNGINVSELWYYYKKDGQINFAKI